jgi:purine catabolism regulator
MEMCMLLRHRVVHRYSPAMSMALRDLLTEEGLALRVRASPAGLDRVIRWVAVTELNDPTPWMEGGELILSTGLRQRTIAVQTAFVERIAGAGAAGLGFGTGLGHGTVPRATVATAERLGLPVLEVPHGTPFIAINRLVAERIAAEAHSRQRQLVDQYDLLARSLLSAKGLAALVRTLHRLIHGQVAVIDRHGERLASAPDRASWPEPGTDGEVALPVDVDGYTAGFLCVRGPGAEADVLPFAVRLVGLELARRHSFLAGRRKLAGQVVEDIVRDVISLAVAERRLAAFRIDVGHPHRVILGCPAPGREGTPATEAETQRLRKLPWDLSTTHDGHEPVLTAVVGRYLVSVTPEQSPANTKAQRIHEALTSLDSSAAVGIGGGYPGIDGLRWSYFEAQAALRQGPGVHRGAPLNLPRLLLSSTDLPLRRLGEQVLRPLTEFDTVHNGDLVVTLHTYLAADCSVQTAAEQLYVHRNTIRYRLDQIERLTGRSLHSTQDRVQLWLALLTCRLTQT